ncbi:AidA/PixA family protein [Chondromyces apiculatus]|uniref:Inclusion body protein n=1 Tax=Chondromyces apiculatus DSM 436 TaxID=1192034 RepID=A0A017TCF6_9BACT|nr:AidA/PixA family protein [Chondromyces apiculatus]EYF06490.1 Hypothetical protein CAP_2020 [Chondromyces apiculatus DSM 436]
MSTIYNVLIVIDCDSIMSGTTDPGKVIQMYADPSIVQKDANGSSTQGSYELSIEVQNQDVIRWFMFPKEVKASDTDQGYTAIVSSDYAWNDAKLLASWTAYDGQGTILIYKPDAQPLPSGTTATVATVGDYKPYIQAQAVLPGRPDPGTNQQEAYTFYVDIYQGTTKVKTYSWDPFVTVTQPG